VLIVWVLIYRLGSSTGFRALWQLYRKATPRRRSPWPFPAGHPCGGVASRPVMPLIL